MNKSKKKHVQTAKIRVLYKYNNNTGENRMETLVFFGMIGMLGLLIGERTLPKSKKVEVKRPTVRRTQVRNFLKK